MNAVASSIGFLVLISLFAFGALGSLLFRKNDVLANRWIGVTSIFASLGGLLFAVSVLFSGHSLEFSIPYAFPLFSISFTIDKLAAFFIAIISLVAVFCSLYGIGYLKHFYKQYDIGVFGFFYHLFIASMMLVVSSANAILFLIVWEIMSVASYFLVIYDRKNQINIKAGFLYLIMTHIGTAFIMVSFLLLYKTTGSFDFEVWRSSASLPFLKNAIFILALIGFGTKAGIIPFHIWLPEAHPAAPSHVSALMSGVMIKTGIYMMIRMFLDILQPVPSWWGLALLIVGSISALLGIIYALAEQDIKRLLAYSSIENIGIVLIGVGSAMLFISRGEQTLALIGISAAFFHILNHAVFKSLLFMGAGSIINETHTRNMEEYGGVIKYMPQTAFLFLAGSMAIAALPPFNGFFSEWLTFQALFQGIMQSVSFEKFIFVFSVGALALTGGLALACFVKLFGITFLARPRSAKISHVKESGFPLILAMAGLALTCLIFGVFSNYLIILFEEIGNSLGLFNIAPSDLLVLKVGSGFASVSPAIVLGALIAVFLLTVFIVKFLINRSQKVRSGITWDCGADLSPRMEISAAGFVMSIILIFQRVLKPSLQHDIEYHDAESRYLRKSTSVRFGTSKIYHSYFYGPLHDMAAAVSLRIKKIQSGNVNAYILYIFIALIVFLLLL